MKYDPHRDPDSEDWLALDEQERIDLVYAQHKRARIKLPNLRAHAIFHAIVENQLAEGIEVVRDTLDRLMTEGLDRHNAIHAIGSVLAGHMHSLMNKEVSGDPNEQYFQELRAFTVEKWLELGE